MVRTVISLEADDKRWLDQRAAEEGVSMTELVRRAVQLLRDRVEEPGFEELVEQARDTWQQGDGLDWQLALRGEWDERRP